MNDDDRTVLLSLLRETERCFLRKQYSRSLLLIDRYFRSRQPERENQIISNTYCNTDHTEDDNKDGDGDKKNNNFRVIREKNGEIKYANAIRLFPSIRLPSKDHEKSFTFVATVLDYEDSWFISSSSSIAARSVIIDRLAGLGLQSFHELSSIVRRQRKQQQRKRKTNNTALTATMKGRRRRWQCRQKNIHNEQEHDDNDNDDIDERWMHLTSVLDYYDNEDEDEKDNQSNVMDMTFSAEATKMGNTISKENNSHISMYKCRHRLRVISAELLSIWIPFWESHGYKLQAFMWTIQVLHHYSPSKQLLLRPESPTTTIEEGLWMRCVCHQLPRYSGKNATFAKFILGIITEKTSYIFECIEFERIWSAINTDHNNGNDDNNAVTDSLIEALDGYLNGNTITSININDNARDYSVFRRCPSHRSLGVSLRTLIKARDWLLEQQLQRRDSNGNPQQNQKHQQQDPRCQQESSAVNGKVLIESKRGMTNYDPRKSLVGFFSRSIFSYISSVKNLSRSTWIHQIPIINTAIATIKAAKMIIHLVVGRYININNEKDKKKWILQFIKPLHSLFSPYLCSCSDSSNNNDMDIDNISIRDTELQRQRVKQTILSIVLVLIGWQRRRFLVRSGKAVTWAVLAPLREFLDALELKPIRA